jgi:ATPase subunit of ABC transporter with duplicated ATPase domains
MGPRLYSLLYISETRPRQFLISFYGAVIMPQPFILFHHVTFEYESAATPLFRDLSAHMPVGWCGIVGANGSGKTTFLKLATGLLCPNEGRIDKPASSIYCPQRTDYPPDPLALLLEDSSRSAAQIRNQLGMESDWLDRWKTLSHGERKRAQVGTALWLSPEILAIDEPTNHMDAEARKILIDALRAYPGVGLLVSHDRELLDTLCRQCLFIDAPKCAVRPGGYSKGCAIGKEEAQAAQKQHDLKKMAYHKLRREAGRRRDLANQYQKRRSKKGIALHDHDSKGKIDAARMTGKDIVGGKLLRQLDGRLDQAKQELENIQIRKQFVTGIWLQGSASQRDMLLRFPAGVLQLGEQKRLDHPQLTLMPTDRIALTGPNGSGKSTLLRKLLPHLNAPADQITYIPQEMDLQQSRALLREVQSLPHEQLGLLMTIISRLGSRPQRVLASAEPSPGETRKLLLALGMTRKPHIIVMDEPTNHMDISSIECLEEALTDCPCSLLLVSHDRRFLQKLTRAEWRISRIETMENRCILKTIP